MQLRKKSKSNKFHCDLTTKLDLLAGINSSENDLFRHYLLGNYYAYKSDVYAIRVPGSTVGQIEVNDENIITSIEVSRDFLITTYPENINDILQEYVGMTLE